VRTWRHGPDRAVGSPPLDSDRHRPQAVRHRAGPRRARFCSPSTRLAWGCRSSLPASECHDSLPPSATSDDNMRTINLISGALLIGVGILFLTDQVFQVAIWMQKGFRALNLDSLAEI
jgi:hypothetical protein